MKVTLELNEDNCGSCIIEREPNDPKIYGVKNAKGESRLLYLVKQRLAKFGLDLIKKRMAKDGHLVDSMQQYLREKKIRKGQRCLALYNDHWAINGLEEDYNEGEARITVVNLEDI